MDRQSPAAVGVVHFWSQWLQHTGVRVTIHAHLFNKGHSKQLLIEPGVETGLSEHQAVINIPLLPAAPNPLKSATQCQMKIKINVNQDAQTH